MLGHFLFLCLAVTAVPAWAAEEDGAQYRGWCTRTAAADKVPAAEREAYIRDCMESLAEADRNPDRSRKRDDGDNEG